MATEKAERLKLIHIAGFVAVAIGLMWVYGSKEPPEVGQGVEVVESFDWEAASEARAAAVAYAGAVRLAQSGANVEGLELVTADTDDGDDYKITYRNAGQSITLFAERQCDRLDMEKLQRPSCWVWR